MMVNKRLLWEHKNLAIVNL